MNLPLGTVIGSGLKMTGGTGGPVVTSGLHLPKKRLPQLDGGIQIGNIIGQIHSKTWIAVGYIFKQYWITNLFQRFQRDKWGNRIAKARWSINNLQLRFSTIGKQKTGKNKRQKPSIQTSHFFIFN